MLSVLIGCFCCFGVKIKWLHHWSEAINQLQFGVKIIKRVNLLAKRSIAYVHIFVHFSTRNIASNWSFYCAFIFDNCILPDLTIHHKSETKNKFCLYCLYMCIFGHILSHFCPFFFKKYCLRPVFFTLHTRFDGILREIQNSWFYLYKWIIFL